MSIYAGDASLPVWNPTGQAASKRKRTDSEGATKSSRTSCDLFIFVDMCASVAFIIASLCPVTWISYTSGLDSSTNSSSSLYYFSRNRNLFYICPNSAQSAVNARGCSVLDLASPPTVTAADMAYWSIIAMRRVEIALFIIAVVFAGVSLLLHVFCCIPSCRHKSGGEHGFWKNGIACGILTGIAAGCQLVGMIIYEVDLYYEVVYNSVNCVDCWGAWPSAVLSQTATTFGPAYALGWCAAGLLVYASFAYLMREFCVIRGCQSPRPDTKDDEQFSEVGSVVASLAPPKGLAREMQFNMLFGQGPQTYDRAAPRPVNYPSLRGFYN